MSKSTKLTGVILVFASAALLFSSCATKPVWISDYTEAQALAQKGGKKIFLLFTADNPDDAEALEVRKNVFDSPELTKAIKKTYVSVNIDFSEARYTAAEASGDADEKQTASAAEAARLLERDNGVAQKYSVEAVPVIYLLTNDGYVLGVIDVDPEVKTAAALLALLDAQAEQADKIAALIALVGTAEGDDKVRAIGDLFDATDQRYRALLLDHMRTALALDNDNSTGVIGKFVFISAYYDAIDSLTAGDLPGGLEKLRTAAANPALAPPEKQEALYWIANFAAQTGLGTRDEVLDYLQQAFDAAPDSEAAPYILQVIDQVKAMPAPEDSGGSPG